MENKPYEGTLKRKLIKQPPHNNRSMKIPAAYLNRRRIIEIMLIIAVMPVMAGLCLVIAILILIDSRGGSVFFRQKRAGKDGKPFMIYKFKTMRCCEEKLDNFFTHPVENVTKFGNFLRKHRLDELPQLINVLRGDMSLIGPRPEIYELYLYFSNCIPYYYQRKLILPGCTGWAQINLPHSLDLDSTKEKLDYDLYYLNNISIKLDIMILFRTFFTMIKAEGGK